MTSTIDIQVGDRPEAEVRACSRTARKLPFRRYRPESPVVLNTALDVSDSTSPVFGPWRNRKRRRT